MLTSFVKNKIDSIVHSGADVEMKDLQNLSSDAPYTDAAICSYLIEKVVSYYEEPYPISPSCLQQLVHLVFDYLQVLKDKRQVDPVLVGKFLRSVGSDSISYLCSSSLLYQAKLVGLSYRDDILSATVSRKSAGTAKKEDPVIQSSKNESKLKRKLDSVMRKYNEVVKERNSLRKDKALLVKKVTSFEALVEDAKKAIQLHKNYDAIRTQLTKENNRLQERISELFTENQCLLEQNSEMIQSSVEDKNAKLISKKREKELDSYILGFFLDHAKQQFTLQQIEDDVNKHSAPFSRDEIESSLKRIGKTWFIQSQHYKSNPPKYGIIPVENSNDEIHYNFDAPHYMDILLISDLHFTKFDLGEQCLIDEVYRYCEKNHISTILNLGDLFSPEKVRVRNRSEGLSLLQRVDSFLQMIPKDTPIVQYILGGNHDDDYTDYGFDPLTYLENHHRGIVSLGYINATVRFNQIPSNSIKLIHEPRRGEVVSVFEEPNVYFKLFGHTHLGELNMPSGYLVVPSLHVDKRRNGAYRMIVQFEEDQTIEKIDFYELSFGLDGSLEEHVPVTFAKDYPVHSGKNKTLQKNKSCDKIYR